MNQEPYQPFGPLPQPPITPPPVPQPPQPNQFQAPLAKQSLPIIVIVTGLVVVLLAIGLFLLVFFTMK